MKVHIALAATLLLLGSAAALAQDYTPTAVTISTEKVKLNGKVYYAHLVMERQTLFGIAKAYGVTEEELYQANPSLKETGLQKSSILLIPTEPQPAPAVQKEAPGKETPQAQGYKEHTVRWYEDIDDIARRYEVSAQEILDFNGLTSRKLTTRQVLKIPVKGVAAPAPVAAPVVAEETPAPAADTLALQEPVQEPAMEESADSLLLDERTRVVVDFSLLLPLKAAGGSSELNMDFYSGVLMALRDLESEGLKVHSHVYDLYAGMPDTEALCRSDFVLGPIANRDLEAVLMRLDGRVPVISPLDQKAGALSMVYRNFIQAPAGADNQYEDLGQWVQEDMSHGDKILFVTEKNAGSVMASVSIRSALAHRGLDYQILNYGMSEGRRVPDSLARTMVKNGVNRVIVASESEPFVGDVVRNLGIMLGKGYNVVMYAPSKTRNFDSIDGTALHDLSAHISTSYHVEYGSPQVDRFVSAYRALFRTEPSQFAFQGYDTARYFVLRVARYGNNWTHKLGQERSRGLHTDFLFDADENQNRHNIAVRRIIYQPDYTTTLIH
ncbi:MAG: LysM peptidoglycan-binding domain-containing protein [Bacteroidales bacterium]|nr:LysM peptidoglycan-binding domain-containing protein [Bacteroidales bacterium]